MIDRSKSRLSLGLSLSLLLAPVAPVFAQIAPTHESGGITVQPRAVNQVSAPARAGDVSRSTPTPSRQIIQGDNLTSAQLGQIFGSGPRTFIVQTSTPIVGDLQIPRGVTLISLLSKDSSGLNIQGNLVDSGRLLFRSNDASLVQANLNANNITVSPGALIASLNNLNLNINALGNIVNAGTISSAGNLNLNAGGSIINALPAGVRGASPIMQAMQNVNLISGSGNFTNAGLIHAIGGNVNIAAMTASQSINLNNLLGTIKAHDAINFRDSGYSGAGDININGGNLLSSVLNLNSGKGTVDGIVRNVNGVVNITACNSHFGATDAPNLKLGNLNVSGDPTYFNIKGDLTISGDISTGGFPLALLASQNVIIDNGANIDTDNLSGDSGDLLIVAGGNLASSGADFSPPTGDTTTTITISNGPGTGGGSLTGGKIDFTGAGSSISTANTGTGKGGNIQMIAYEGSLTGAGTIIMDKSDLYTGADPAASGNVSIIAGASSGDAVSLSNIYAAGGTTTKGGSVSIITASPKINGGNISVLDGAASGGTFTQNVLQKANIVSSGVIQAGAAGFVQLVAGGNVQVDGNLSAMGVPSGPSSITIASGGNVTLNDGITTLGVDNAGDVSIFAGANVSVAFGSVQLSDGSGAGKGSLEGGSIVINNGITAFANGGTSNGGNIQLLAYEGSNPGTGTVNLTGGTIDTGANSTGQNGSLLVVGGAGSGKAVSLNSPVDTTGSTSSSAAGLVGLFSATPSIKFGPVTIQNGVCLGCSFIASPFQSGEIEVASNIITDGGGVVFATAGDITIGGDVTTTRTSASQGGPIAVFAGGSIQSSSGGTPFTFQTGTNGKGAGTVGTISAVAGADLQSGASIFTVTVNGGSSTGGSINFQTLNGGATSAGVFLQAEGSCCSGAGNGGTVTLMAFADGTGNEGQVNLLKGTTAVDSHSPSNTKSSGSIFITAGNKGTAIDSGDLITHFGAPGTGAVTINAAQPDAGSGVTFSNGSISSGSFGVGASNGGSINLESVDASNNISINSGKDLNITGVTKVFGLANIGTSIDMSVPGTLTVEGGTTGAISTGSFLFGGFINITANDIVVTGGTDPLTLTADAAATGNTFGGFVTVTQTGTGSLNIGTAATGNNIQISAKGGGTGGAGGTVTLSSSGDLIVDPAAITADPTAGKNGAGATLSFSAKDLKIDGSLAANGSNSGAGGSISLNSNSSAAFTVGGSSGNYINGKLSADAGTTGAGGSISILNSGTGGIKVNDPADLSVKATFNGNGGSVQFFATNGPLTFGSGTLSADPNGTGTSGLVRLSGASLVFPTTGGGLDVSAKTGTILISTSNATVTNINTVNSFTGKDIALTATNSGYTLGANTVNGTNSVALITKNTITAASVVGIQPTKTLVLVSTGGDVGTSATPISLNFDTVTLNSSNGDVYADSTSTGDASGNVNLVDSTVDSVTYKNSALGTFSFSASNLPAGKSIVTKSGTDINAGQVILNSSRSFALAGDVYSANSVAIIGSESIDKGDYASIFSPQITVVSLNGNVGADASNRVTVNSPLFTVQAKNGSVFVQNPSLGNVSGNATFVDSTVSGTTYKNEAAGTYSVDLPNVTNQVKSSANITAPDVVVSSSGGIDFTGATITASNSASFIGGKDIFSLGTLVTPALAVVTTGSGNVGTNATSGRLSVNAATMTAAATGTGSVWLTNTSKGDLNGDLNIGSATINGTPYNNGAGVQYSVTANGIASGKAVKASSNITATDIDLSSSGGFNLGANLKASNSLALISTDSIDNSSVDLASVPAIPTLVVATKGAGTNIGTSATPLAINSANVTLNSSSGSVFATNTTSGDGSANMNFLNAKVNGVDYTNSAGATFLVEATGLTIGSMLSASGIDISATDIVLNSAGGISLAGKLTGTASIGLVSAQSITSLGPVSTGKLALVSSNNLGVDASNRLVVDASQITLQGTNVFVTNTSTGDINGNVNIIDGSINKVVYKNSATTTYSLNATGIASGKNLVSQAGVDITALNVVLGSSGGFALAGNVTPTNSLAVISEDSITTSSVPAASLVVPQLVVAATGSGSSIGSSAQPLVVSTMNGTFQAGKSLFVRNDFASSTALINSTVEGVPFTNSAGDTFSLSAPNVPTGQSLITGGAVDISAPIVELNVGGGFGLTGKINAGNYVALISGDAINNLGPITTPSLSLRSMNAGIGMSNMLRLFVDVPTLAAQAKTNVFITNVSKGDTNGNVNLIENSAFGTSITNNAGGTYSLLANGISSGKAIVAGNFVGVNGTDVDLTSSGTFQFSAIIQGKNSVALISNDSITSLGFVIAPTVVLAATGAGASIGTGTSPGSRITVNAENVAFNATNGSVFVENTYSVGPDIVLITGNVNGTNYDNKALDTYDVLATAFTLSTGAVPVSAKSVVLGSGQANVQVTGAQITAENITLNAPLGSVLLLDTTLSAMADVGTGNGGSITIDAKNVSSAFPIVLNANALPGGGNGGTINVTLIDGLSMGAGIGQLSFLANAGATGKGGTVDLKVTDTKGTLDVDPASVSVSSTDGDGGKLAFSSAGQLTFSTAGLNVDGTGSNGSGGIISIQGDTLIFSILSNLTLSANGAGTGSGGQVSVSSTNPGVTPEVNVGAGKFSISATGGAAGGDGGSATVSSAGNLIFNKAGVSVDPSALGNGNGGTVSMSAALSGGTLTLNDLSYTYDGAGDGNGGGIIFAGQNLAFTPGMALSANASNTGIGNGGTILVQTNSNIIIDQLTGFTVSAQGGSNASLAGNGGIVSLSTIGNVQIQGADFKVNPRGVNGDGGVIALQGATVSTTGTGTLELKANGGGVLGTGTGDGGSITVTQSTTTAQTIGALFKANFLLNASAGGGGGSGGTVQFITGGNLTVDATNGLFVTAKSPTNQVADGGSIALSAGAVAAGNLLVTGDLDASAAGSHVASVGGIINLQSNSKTAFAIKTGSSNGTKGNLLVNGNAFNGSISVTNFGGGITDGQANMNAGDISFITGKDGGITVSGTLGTPTTQSILLAANGKGTITASKMMQAVDIAAVSSTGNISMTNINVSTPTAVSANTGGNVTITGTVVAPQAPLAMTIDGVNGKTVMIKSIGSINTSNDIIGASVTLQSTSTSNLHTVTVGASNTVMSTSGTVIITGPAVAINGSVDSFTNTSITSKVAGITLGKSAQIEAGSLSGAPGEPAPLVTANIAKAGSITLSSAGTGASAISTGDGASLVSNGAALTIKTTKANGDISIGDGNVITANGGAISISSLGQLKLGTTMIGPVLLARSLNGGSGTVTLSGSTGLSLMGSTDVQANKAVTISTKATTANLTIGAGVSVQSGVGGSSGNLGITSAGTGASKLDIGAGSIIIANKGTLKITAKGNASIGDDSIITANGNSITITGSGTTSLSSLGALEGVTISATKIGSTGGAITITSTGLLTVGGPSKINGDAGIKLSSKGNYQIDDGAAVVSKAKLELSNTATAGTSSTGDGVSLTGTSVLLSSTGDNLQFGKNNTITANGSSVGNISMTMKKSTGLPMLSVDQGFNITTVNGSITLSAVGIDFAGSPTSVMAANGSSGSITMKSKDTLNLAEGKIDAVQDIKISSSASQVSTAQTLIGTVTLPKSVTITGVTGVQIGAVSTIRSKGNLTITASGTTANLKIEDNVSLSAGKLTGANPSSAFSPTAVLNKGSILLTGGAAVKIGDGQNWTANGGDLKVVAKTGNMDVGNLGTGNSFNAFGGNIQMLAKGLVVGKDKNVFTAYGMGSSSPLSNTGGGVEIGSGLISSTAITSALGLKGAPIPAVGVPAGITGVLIGDVHNTDGAIVVNNKSGSVSPIVLTNSILNLNFPDAGAGIQGGVQVFDAAATGSSVTMPNATFNTSAFKPICYTSTQACLDENDEPSPSDYFESTNECATSNTNGEFVLYNFDKSDGLLLSAKTNSEAITQRTKSAKIVAQFFANPRTRVQQTAANVVRLVEGEVFITASSPLAISTDHVDVIACKGALASVKSFQGNTYVRSCSPAGTVSLKVNGKKIALNPGEEMLVAQHKPDASEVNLADGVGRRHSHTIAVGDKHITISDFAIITLLSNTAALAGLRRSGGEGKQLVERILKIAATIDTVLKHRGAYTSSR